MTTTSTQRPRSARPRPPCWRCIGNINGPRLRLGRQLGLGPDDINPLDVDFDQEWESADDPHIEVWKRAVQLRHRLSVAHFDWLRWWRRPAQLRLVSEAETSAPPEPGGPV